MFSFTREQFTHSNRKCFIIKQEETRERQHNRQYFIGLSHHDQDSFESSAAKARDRTTKAGKRTILDIKMVRNTTARRKQAVKAPLLLILTMMGMVGLWWCLASTSPSLSSVEARLGPDSAPTALRSSNHNEQSRSASSFLQRQLTALSFFGREPDMDDYPLPLCGGDCDGDSEVCAYQMFVG